MAHDTFRLQNWCKRIADWSERLVDTVVASCQIFPMNKRNELVPIPLRIEAALRRPDPRRRSARQR